MKKACSLELGWKFFALAACLLFVSLSGLTVTAQSTSQDFPTPVTTNEINGTVKPRDVGDPRLTTYFYLVETGVGDLFVNILTRNFTGDIDLFTQTSLQPLAKIVIYADLAETETGRVIYLRKPEKILLRVQGRTPGDDAASIRLKFAGSFVASTATEVEQPALPKVIAQTDSGVRVNSVGTILPKPTPTEAERAAASAKIKAETETPPDSATPTQAAANKQEDAKVEETEREESKKVEVVVTDETGENKVATSAPTKAKSTKAARVRRPAAETKQPEADVENAKAESTEKPKAVKASKREKTPEPPKVDPLANIRLVVSFKDGTKIERPMSEVQRFSVDKGQLTVISKDGSIGRYSLLDVAKVTIE